MAAPAAGAARSPSAAHRSAGPTATEALLAEIDPVIYQAQYDQAVAKKAQDEALRLQLDLAVEHARTRQQFAPVG